MKEKYIITSKSGQFLAGERFVDEYPDAEIFHGIRAARNAQKNHPGTLIILRYGLQDEEVVVW